MRFKDWEKENDHVQAQRLVMERATAREWYLGDMLVKISVGPFKTVIPGRDAQYTVNVYVELARYQQGCIMYDCTGKLLFRDVFVEHGWSSNPLSNFTSEQLVRIAQCKAVAEAWIRGDLDEFPIEAPEFIARAPLPGKPATD